VEQLGPLDELLSAALLKRTIIHGDYGLHNLLFRRDGTVMPVDFELARLEWRLSDLVYDFESIQWFMAAYHATFPLNADEWRLFAEVWRFYKLQGAVQYWNSYFETNGPARKLISARDAIAQADWVANHQEHLLAQLQGQRPRWWLAQT
jgi:Ser/Thr protein kinase RdoA (MazF antagonist)